jgi:hypothetical protein
MASIDFDNVTLAQAQELTHCGQPPSGPGAETDNTSPACPVCGSQMRRCVDWAGNLVWPWHVERQLAFSRRMLADVDWVANGPASAVSNAKSLVEAYNLGRASASHVCPDNNCCHGSLD